MSAEKEKKKTAKEVLGGGKGDADVVFGGPDKDTLKNLARVRSGIHDNELSVGGKTVEQVRKAFSGKMEIDPKAKAFIDGKPVTEKTVVKPDVHLVFVRHSGEKGWT